MPISSCQLCCQVRLVVTAHPLHSPGCMGRRQTWEALHGVAVVGVLADALADRLREVAVVVAEVRLLLRQPLLP